MLDEYATHLQLFIDGELKFDLVMLMVMNRQQHRSSLAFYQ